ncbi:20041_t:CDS:2, partial [Racocetra fulgida]
SEIKAAHFVPGQYVDLQAPSSACITWDFKTHRSAGSTGQNQ